jgi:hypothetical protein
MKTKLRRDTVKIAKALAGKIVGIVGHRTESKRLIGRELFDRDSDFKISLEIWSSPAGWLRIRNAFGFFPPIRLDISRNSSIFSREGVSSQELFERSSQVYDICALEFRQEFENLLVRPSHTHASESEEHKGVEFSYELNPSF